MTDTNANNDALRGKVLAVLTGHPSRVRAISMTALHKAVFGSEPGNKINGTRRLRQLITEMRADGLPIASTADRTGGGYYLATSNSELKDYCRRIRNQGLKKLVLEANIRKMSLPNLLDEIQLELT